MIGHIVSRGQRDLADDGKREWDSEIEKSLDDEYPDWKYPETTHMIPKELHKQGNVGEKAEKIFFDLLKSFGEHRKEPMFVVHSYNFKERISELKSKSVSSKKWNIGEHDFVLVHRQAGFVFFQVKAAANTAKTYREAQKQIDKDRDAMKFFFKEVGDQNKKIATKGVDKLFSRFPGFVVMPNCPRPDSSASTHAEGIFEGDCVSVHAFSDWWDRSIGCSEQGENDAVEDVVKEELFNMLVKRFVGLVLVGRCLASRHSIDNSFAALRINTEEQLKVYFDFSPDRWIVGPAGSGKTCLLMEKVILLAKNIISDTLDQKILVACYNRPLSLKIRGTIEHALKVVYDIQKQDQTEEPCSVVDVKTFDKILMDINGSFTIEDGEHRVEMALQKLKQDTYSAVKHAYDHIFVDEGQDLYHAQWPSLLKMMHKSSYGHAAVEDDEFDPRYFWVFYDSNQHLHLSKENTLPDYSDGLQKSHRLHKILRNTKKVFLQVNKYFEPLVKTSVPVGVYHREVGLKIEWHPDDSLRSKETTSDTNRVQSIVKHVEYLKRNDVQKRDICVLVRDVETRNKLNPNLEGVGIECQNAEELYTNTNNNKVVVESIRRFKGLESKVVILYDPPYGAESKTRELLYTAISRCLCYLVVISTKQGCESLQSEAGLCGIPGAFPNPRQLLASEPVNKDTVESTAVVFPAKRQFQDDDGSNYNQLYKRIKEIEGDSGGFMYLLGQSRSAVNASVRDREFKKLLPSLWGHLQLFPEYRNVTQPALSKIGALLEYHVLQKSKSGNYVGNMEAKRQEVDSSTQKKEIDADVAGALKVGLNWT